MISTESPVVGLFVCTIDYGTSFSLSARNTSPVSRMVFRRLMLA